MAVLHRAYTLDAQVFIAELKSTVLAQDKVLLSEFRQFAVQIAETPSTDIQEFLTWIRFDDYEWLIEDVGGTGYYFLILLASKLTAAPSLSSRETIETYVRGLDACLQKAEWDEDDIYRLIHGDRLERMIRFYSEIAANILFNQPFFKSTIERSGVGWLSPVKAKKYYEQLKLSRNRFNSLTLKQVYEHTIQMLEASISTNSDLILIID